MCAANFDERNKKIACTICSHFAAPTFRGVFRHIGNEHSLRANFEVKCGINGCQAFYKKMGSWRKHIGRHHKYKLNVQATSLNTSEMLGSDDDDDVHLHNTSNLDDNGDDLVSDSETSTDEMQILESDPKKNAARFILKTRDGRKMTQTCLDGVLLDVSLLVEHNVQSICHLTLQALKSAGASQEILGIAKSSILSDNPGEANLFEGLDTEYRQNSFFREHFGLVEPVERVLGRERVQLGKRSIIRNNCCYDVPLLESLRNLLTCKVVEKQVRTGHKSSGEVLADYCDGEQYAKHLLYKNEPLALQIFFYNDDVEVANPLGSSATLHKLSLFYYTLGNLLPSLRSPTNSIQLVTAVKTVFVDKYGVDKVMEPFVEAVSKLESKEGVSFVIDGRVQSIRGTLAIVSGDNLSSQLLGGFKSLNSAFRRCRRCMATKETMQTKFTHEGFTLRTIEDHKKQCERLANPSLHEHYATTYGIKRDTILNSLQYFHVITGMPPDVMHDVLEGSLQLEIRCLLVELITVKKLFSLTTLNNRIANFPYGPDAKDHPPRPLPETCLSGSSGASLKLGASETWCLARLLPLLLGDLVPEDNSHWINYLLLLDITDIVMAPACTRAIAASLREMIAEHHSAFVKLYPDRPMIPKMHYMVHIPEWILMCGPLRHLWCMRYEAKHQFFKQMARILGNFKNVAKSLAKRHQRYMCYILNNPDAFLRDTVEPGPVKSSQISNLEYEQELLEMFSPDDFCTGTVQRTKWVEIRGTKYQLDQCVLLRFSGQDPVFALIVDIVLTTSPLLVVEPLNTICYSSHFHCYEVQRQFTRAFELVTQSQLADHCVLGMYQPLNDAFKYLIPLKYLVLDELDSSV